MQKAQVVPYVLFLLDGSFCNQLRQWLALLGSLGPTPAPLSQVCGGAGSPARLTHNCYWGAAHEVKDST